MNKQFESIYSTLQHQRDSILNAVKASPDTWHVKPAPGKWSIGQILTHIITSEKLSLGYMKKKMKGVDQLDESGLGETIRLWILIISQRVPLKYKAPRVLVENTPEVLPLDEFTKQWDAVRLELAEFLNSLEEKHIHKLIYKHPYAGRFDARQALIFLREHLIHHTPQINRILKHPHK